MRWLCVYLPALPLEALAPTPEQPAAVVEPAGRWRRLSRLNASARRRGLRPGVEATAALGQVPGLRLLERCHAAEVQVLEAVACWAYAYGHPVTIDSPAGSVSVEIGRSLRSFGGWTALARRIEHDATALGYSHRFGVAPTLAAAALFARAGRGLDAPVSRRRDIAPAIRDWPLARLMLSEPVREVLRGAGLRTIGELLPMPPAALARRCGPELPLLLDRLLGRAPEVWHNFVPPARYRRRQPLFGEADSSGALLFPLKAMLGDFALYLRARDVAVQRFRLIFDGGVGYRPALEVGLLAPARDPVRLLQVTRERLETLALERPVVALELVAERFERAIVRQQDLFEDSGGLENFESLLERLLARLGEAAVRRLTVMPDARPERAWSGQPGAATGEHPPRPFWLLPEPRPIPPPQLLGPPERIECGWWDGQPVQRDYHLAEDATGRKLWVYREPAGRQWWLHGLWQ